MNVSHLVCPQKAKGVEQFWCPDNKQFLAFQTVLSPRNVKVVMPNICPELYTRYTTNDLADRKLQVILAKGVIVESQGSGQRWTGLVSLPTTASAAECPFPTAIANKPEMQGTRGSEWDTSGFDLVVCFVQFGNWGATVLHTCSLWSFECYINNCPGLQYTCKAM